MTSIFMAAIILYCFRIIWVSTQIGKLNTLFHTYNIVIWELAYPRAAADKFIDYDSDVVNLFEGIFDLKRWRLKDFYKRRSPSLMEVMRVVREAGQTVDAKNW